MSPEREAHGVDDGSGDDGAKPSGKMTMEVLGLMVKSGGDAAAQRFVSTHCMPGVFSHTLSCSVCVLSFCG